MELKQIAPDYSVSPGGNVWSHKNGKIKQLKPYLSGKAGKSQYHTVAICNIGVRESTISRIANGVRRAA